MPGGRPQHQAEHHEAADAAEGGDPHVLVEPVEGLADGSVRRVEPVLGVGLDLLSAFVHRA